MLWALAEQLGLEDFIALVGGPEHAQSLLVSTHSHNACFLFICLFGGVSSVQNRSVNCLNCLVYNSMFVLFSKTLHIFHCTHRIKLQVSCGMKPI